MTSLNSSINSNSEYSTICFCSSKAIEKKNCDECFYMLPKEVKQLNAYLYQNQKQLSIKLQQLQQLQQQLNNSNICEVEVVNNKKKFRKSVEICFCECPAREIHCDNCSFGIPLENDIYNENGFSECDIDEDLINHKDDFNNFIDECALELSKNQIKSFVL